MVRTESRAHDIELAGHERKRFSAPMACLDVEQATLLRGCSEHAQHALGTVEADDSTDCGSEGKAQVAGTAANVEEARRRGHGGRDEGLRMSQIRTSRMNRAVEIRLCTGIELVVNGLVVSSHQIFRT